MTFPASAYLLAVLGGALATFASLPLWRAWCVRTGLVDDPGQRKIHNIPIPLAGGLAVLEHLSLRERLDAVRKARRRNSEAGNQAKKSTREV